VPWLKRLVAGLSPRRPGITPRSVHVGCVVDKVALGQVFLRVFRLLPVNIIPPFLHTHPSPPHEVCHSSGQAAHYHILDHTLGASSLTQHLAGTEDVNLFNDAFSVNRLYSVDDRTISEL
jgi:hypothetical protein